MVSGDEVKETGSAVPQSITGVIPVRYGSTRFPGKPLAALGDRTILHHVHDRVRRCTEIGKVLVATDDDRILREVLAFGGTAVMTSRTHRCGTDRVAEAVEALAADAALIVNIQGDEPFVEPSTIDAVATMLRSRPETVWTAVSPLTDRSALDREDVVKAAVARDGRVLYFSRAPIPYRRGGAGTSSIHYHHVGIYGYSRIVLQRIVRLPPSPLEEAESLEQLRLLEAGIEVRAVTVPPGFGGIDTIEDLERARRALATAGREGGSG